MKSKKKSISRIFFVGLLAFGVIGGTYKICDTFSEKALPYDLHQTTSDDQASPIDHWVKFNPEDKGFSILFPYHPNYTAKDFPIPKSKQSLSYNEYHSSEKEMMTSVGYAVLPDEWVKHHATTVLKGALKVILKQTKGAHLVGQSANTFKTYPALDFEHYLSDKGTAGTLVLVGSVLYKVEITYPIDQREEAHSKLVRFIGSFDLL